MCKKVKPPKPFICNPSTCFTKEVKVPFQKWYHIVNSYLSSYNTHSLI